jgi:hypothetical protein
MPCYLPDSLLALLVTEGSNSAWLALLGLTGAPRAGLGAIRLRNAWTLGKAARIAMWRNDNLSSAWPRPLMGQCLGETKPTPLMRGLTASQEICGNGVRLKY